MDYQLGPGPLQVDQNTIDEKIKGDIGIVENGDVATHAITSGYYVIWKGDLYVAKTDISSGTTLSAASNGNLTAKPNGLGAEVAALNSKLTPQNLNMTLLSGWSLKSWGKVTAIKTGNIVVVSISGLIGNADVNVDSAFAQIDGLSPAGFVMATGKTNYQSGQIILSAHYGETNIYINSAHANENNYGQLIIPVNN